MRNRFSGQTFRFIVSMSIIMLVLGSFTGLFVRWLFYRSLSAELDAGGVLLARFIAERNANAILEEEPLTLLEIEDTLVAVKPKIPNLVYGYIRNSQGRVLAHNFDGAFPVALLEVNRVGTERSISIRRVDLGGRIVRDVATNVAGPGTGEIHLGISESTMEADLRRLTRTLMMFFGLAFVISLVMIVITSKAITKPVQDLTRAAEKLGAGSLETRVSFKKNGEIGVLGDAFNRMAGNLERSRDDLQELNLELEQSRDELQEVNLELEQSRDELQRINMELEEEITEKDNAHDALSLALREKETLLREVHHRVKNNLQALSGLLNLQIYYNKDERSKSTLNDCCNRLQTMSLIHKGLYESGDVASINFARYIEHLSRQIMQTQAVQPDKVKLSLELDQVTLPVDTAIPAGLILNELLTNAIKHAFPDGRGGRLTVRFKAVDKGRFQMEVEDDGVGLPESVDFHAARSMGMQLVKILTEQLGGYVEVLKGPGARFSVQFSEYKEAGTLVV